VAGTIPKHRHFGTATPGPGTTPSPPTRGLLRHAQKQALDTNRIRSGADTRPASTTVRRVSRVWQRRVWAGRRWTPSRGRRLGEERGAPVGFGAIDRGSDAFATLTRADSESTNVVVAQRDSEPADFSYNPRKMKRLRVPLRVQRGPTSTRSRADERDRSGFGSAGSSRRGLRRVQRLFSTLRRVVTDDVPAWNPLVLAGSSPERVWGHPLKGSMERPEDRSGHGHLGRFFALGFVPLPCCSARGGRRYQRNATGSL
jgi:hypothetical protein